MNLLETGRIRSLWKVVLLSHLTRCIVLFVFVLFAIPTALWPVCASGVSEATGTATLALPSAVNYSYRNYTQIKDDLLGIENQHSDISKVYDIGDSYEKIAGSADRDILAIKISDNVLVDEDEPEVLIVGLHHAREWTTSEIVLEIADNLTDEYGNDTRISWLVDNREVWIVPVVNPDGLDYALQHDQWWRKNRRPNFDGSYGVDLNRNYMGSMNGDPAGSWGGAGASHVPSDETYCGQTPFSEPETSAIRSLVLSRDFELALDFHSYSQLVLWPWGYTASLTPDNADLVRIGNAFAALNGYTPEQSVGLYPTTGDSIDWLYGGEDIYAYCFEVGVEFHPAKTSDVLAIISNNLPPVMLGIEIAGDREERPFLITHTPLATRNYSSLGFGIEANITAARGVDTNALSLVFRVDGSSWSEVPVSLESGNDTYSGIVPPQPVGSVVDYYFVARDTSGVELMSPRYAPYDLYSFSVAPEGPVPPIEVEFDPPRSIDGSSGFVVAATANNVSVGSDLVLHMRNLTTGFWENITMVESTQGNYSCSIQALTPLGDYELWLTVEAGVVVQWSSAVTVLSVLDETPPVLSSHTAEQIDQDHVLLEVNCSDAYGVASVVIAYREQGSPAYTSDLMSLTRGTATDGTWSITIAIGGASVIEYNFTASDSNQSSVDPAGGGMHEFVPVLVPEFPAAVVALIAAVTVAVLVISRVRRS